MTDYSRREADRLRVIIETLAFSNPEMTIAEAAPAIFEIEKRARKLEFVTDGDGVVTLPNDLPETVAAFINTQPTIIDFILTSKKIDAIKETRRLARVGLKEAKDGVERWLEGPPF